MNIQHHFLDPVLDGENRESSDPQPRKPGKPKLLNTS